MGNQVDQELEHDGLKMNLVAVSGKAPRFPINQEAVETVYVMLAHDLPVD